MKISTTCIKCSHKELNSTGPTFIQINDQGLYPYTCPNGHKNAIILQQEKFELLFQSAAYAITDGYLKEAVSSIASSLERLYEFAINVICEKYQLQKEILDLAWKSVSKQSERQFGAFIFLYVMEYKKMPPIPSSRHVEFRNNVTHKGYFPTHDETVNYGQDILDMMSEIVFNLRNTCQGSIDYM